MWIVTLLPAFAGAQPDPHPSPPASHASIEQVRRAMRRGDYTDARLHAARVLAHADAHDAEAALWMGVAHHRERRPDRAVPYFEAGLERQPDGPWADHLAFGLAEALAELGRPREAQRWLRKAVHDRALDTEDTARVAIDRALFKVQRRGIARRPTEALTTLLDATHPHLATVQQARARRFLVHQWLDLADSLVVTDPSELERRSSILLGARMQVDATAELGEHRIVLEQIDRLARAYERIGDDVLSAGSRPLTDVRNVWWKSTELLAVGLRHAERIEHDGELARFRDRHRAMSARLDGLQLPTGGLSGAVAANRHGQHALPWEHAVSDEPHAPRDLHRPELAVVPEARHPGHATDPAAGAAGEPLEGSGRGR